MTELTQPAESTASHRAYERVQASSALQPYADILLNEGPQGEPDWLWVATAPEAELIRWAEDGRDAQRTEMVLDEVAPSREEDWQ